MNFIEQFSYIPIIVGYWCSSLMLLFWFILLMASAISGSSGIVLTFGSSSALDFSGIVFPNTISFTKGSCDIFSRFASYPLPSTGWIRTK